MFWTLELATHLEDAPWPATKDDLIDYAIRTGAPVEVSRVVSGVLMTGPSPAGRAPSGIAGSVPRHRRAQGVRSTARTGEASSPVQRRGRAISS